MRIVIALLCMGGSLYGAEYLYPVAWVQRPDGIKIYLNYQKSVAGSSELLLWEWDPVTKVVGPVVLPSYTPAAVKLLPGSDRGTGGLCFVDKGRVLVKSFNKRSPKAISFYEPIDDISLIEWVSPSAFYFMAKEGHNFGIFQGTMQGSLTSLVYESGHDYLYPQVVGTDLYCIRRTQQKYQLIQAPVPQRIGSDDAEDYSQRVQKILTQQHRLVTHAPAIATALLRPLLELQQPAAFLKMQSDREGFYVEHPLTIDRNSTLVHCKLHRIYRDMATEWHDEILFEFQLATHLLVGLTTRLYESLLPLLPRIERDVIYYVHSSCPERADVYSYDMTTKESALVSCESTAPLNFAPLRVQPLLFYGGSLLAEDLGTGNSLPAIWINEEGLLCAELPALFDAKSVRECTT